MTARENAFHIAATIVCGALTLLIFAWLALTYVPGVVL